MDPMFYFKDGSCIPLGHANIIRSNWRKGLRWNLCSPLFNLTRAQVAEVVKFTKKA